MRPRSYSDRQRLSATIHPFPIGGRAALNRRLGEIEPDAFHSYPAVEFGGGWYHDEAIAEDERKREH